jgi:uncharacterized protein Yka (UPF0111/DUF47 family)
MLLRGQNNVHASRFTLPAGILFEVSELSQPFASHFCALVWKILELSKETYRVTEVRAGTIELDKVLLSTTAEVAAAVRDLEPEKALKHCIDINRYENESDRLCRTLIAQLFDEERDPVQIIKWKEIFEVIETAVDKCEDVANVIEGVILKSA